MALLFHPAELAGQGLYYGGEVDDNGNVFREKDVLEEDYSKPLLFGDETYEISKEVWIPDTAAVSLQLRNETTIILSKEERERSVY